MILLSFTNKAFMKYKRYLILIILPFILSGCGGSSEPQVGDDLDWHDYKKVSLIMDVEILPGPSAQLEDLLACTGSGTITSYLYFAPGGGDPMYQKSSYQLTSYACYNFGKAYPCVTHLMDENVYDPRPIELNAQLHVSEDKNDLHFHIDRLPTNDYINVEYVCGPYYTGPATLPDPAVLSQLITPFYLEYWQVPFTEGETIEATRSGMSLNGLNMANITLHKTLERVTEIEE
ncbi:TPA: hypothetical protein DDZ01_02795 [Candidatus Uhrbacteria bacterium]|nr:MAG: hypothetical protein UT94_C0058G0005 [Candidatus Uhrbacteria bacterium GW2011_GWF2_40_263]HBK34898.1 hypothetical protein [Candidatus Uhrbacteria bacterium]HCB56129.1 hypothetical protein [Candidatus Uhrbacteria bacterium]